MDKGGGEGSPGGDRRRPEAQDGHINGRSPSAASSNKAAHPVQVQRTGLTGSKVCLIAILPLQVC